MAAIDPWFIALNLAEALSIGVCVLSIARSVQNVLCAAQAEEWRCRLEEFEKCRAAACDHGCPANIVDVRGDLPVGDETYTYTAQPSPDSSDGDTSVEVDTDESD